MFASSEAQGIARHGTNLDISGFGFNSQIGANQAILWQRPIPAPHSAAALAMLGLALTRRRR